MTTDQNKLLATYWEKYAIWISGILLVIISSVFVDINERLKHLEDKARLLEAEKVSRVEIHNIEDRLYKRMDSVKTDIIERLDLYLAGQRSKK